MSIKLRQLAEKVIEYAELQPFPREYVLLAKAALSEQPAQGEAVAEIHPAVTNGRNTSRVFAALLEAGRDLPVGTKLYTAPPATSVPDDVAKDAARYRWLRLRVGVDRYGINIPGFVLPDGDLTDASIDAMLAAAAPEVPRG